MQTYPLPSSHDLARLLVGRELRWPEDAPLVWEIRALLSRFGCPKTGSTRQARWIIDEEMAKRVATQLGRPLH